MIEKRMVTGRRDYVNGAALGNVRMTEMAEGDAGREAEAIAPAHLVVMFYVPLRLKKYHLFLVRLWIETKLSSRAHDTEGRGSLFNGITLSTYTFWERRELGGKRRTAQTPNSKFFLRSKQTESSAGTRAIYATQLNLVNHNSASGGSTTLADDIDGIETRTCIGAPEFYSRISGMESVNG